MKLPDWERARQYVFGRLEKELSPELTYHSLRHTRDDVLPAAERLAAAAKVDGEDLLLLRTAALYHDIGFVERIYLNEPIAVRIAAETLPDFGYTPAQIAVVSDIIMATRLPQDPHTFLEELMADADLDSLGREDYFEVSHLLYLERLAQGMQMTAEQWCEIQLIFLTDHSYFTSVARSLRDAGKQNNIAVLKRRLSEYRHPESHDVPAPLLRISDAGYCP